jgi:hypothetical protein
VYRFPSPPEISAAAFFVGGGGRWYEIGDGKIGKCERMKKTKKGKIGTEKVTGNYL